MIINDIQFNVSLEEIFVELQTQLRINGSVYFQKEYRDSGTHIQVQCPYHGEGQERKPSAGIRKKDGIFHCFACNEVHSLPEVISYVLGYNDILGKEGIKWLTKNFATVQVEERKDVDLDFDRKTGRKNRSSNNSTMSNSKDNFVTEEELDKYRYYHKYWKERGITDNEVIELFDLGYDRQQETITFPVRDERGNCLFVARRSVISKFFNYPEGVAKPLYGLYELYTEWSIAGIDELDLYYYDVFVCESMIDCLLLWQAGWYAVALNGTGNDLQFKQLRDLPVRKLILATDNDVAGQKARKRIKQNVKYKIITEIEFPEGIKDVGDLGKAGRFEDIKNIIHGFRAVVKLSAQITRLHICQRHSYFTILSYIFFRTSAVSSVGKFFRRTGLTDSARMLISFSRSVAVGYSASSSTSKALNHSRSTLISESVFERYVTPLGSMHFSGCASIYFHTSGRHTATAAPCGIL